MGLEIFIFITFMMGYTTGSISARNEHKYVKCKVDNHVESNEEELFYSKPKEINNE